MYNSLLATHVSWEQANKKGNCGMDEEEVDTVAEKELKGNRQKGKALPLTLTLRLCKKWGKKVSPGK